MRSKSSPLKQLPLPNLVTEWAVLDPQIAVLDADPNRLAIDRELSCVEPGETAVLVNACIPGLSPAVVSDVTGVRCLDLDECGNGDSRERVLAAVDELTRNAGEKCRFLLTARHMFKKPVTVNYPYQKVPVFPKYRGKQVLMRDEEETGAEGAAAEPRVKEVDDEDDQLVEV